jgi:hypothetical protein
MLTKEEAAAQMDGNEYGSEGSPELFAEMKTVGLVAVFGYSDDVTELRGAVHDETYSETYFTPDGILQNQCEDGCPYFKREAARAKLLKADFGDNGWTYETPIPHATFNIVEDGDHYGQGIVFALADAA